MKRQYLLWLSQGSSYCRFNCATFRYHELAVYLRETHRKKEFLDNRKSMVSKGSTIEMTVASFIRYPEYSAFSSLKTFAKKSEWIESAQNCKNMDKISILLLCISACEPEIFVFPLLRY